MIYVYLILTLVSNLKWITKFLYKLVSNHIFFYRFNTPEDFSIFIYIKSITNDPNTF